MKFFVSFNVLLCNSAILKPPCLIILESEPTYVSKARGGQMPDPRATQNLLMPHPRDWQGRQMFRSGPAGRSWICLMHKHTKKNLANIQPPWPHAWSITHVCRFTSLPSFGISDLPTFLAAGPVYSPAPGFMLFLVFFGTASVSYTHLTLPTSDLV